MLAAAVDSHAALQSLHTADQVLPVDLLAVVRQVRSVRLFAVSLTLALPYLRQVLLLRQRLVCVTPRRMPSDLPTMLAMTDHLRPVRLAL